MENLWNKEISLTSLQIKAIEELTGKKGSDAIEHLLVIQASYYGDAGNNAQLLIDTLCSPNLTNQNLAWKQEFLTNENKGE